MSKISFCSIVFEYLYTAFSVNVGMAAVASDFLALRLNKISFCFVIYMSLIYGFLIR